MDQSKAAVLIQSPETEWARFYGCGTLIVSVDRTNYGEVADLIAALRAAGAKPVGLIVDRKAGS